MTNEEIEGTKLIAALLGFPSNDKHWWHHANMKYHEGDINSSLTLEMCHFHDRWDWMMIACKAWKKINPVPAYDRYLHFSDMLDNMIVMDYDVKMAFKQLVINIQWYNNAMKSLTIKEQNK